MKRTIIALVAGLMVGLGGMFIAASPAAASLNDCPGGTGCAWTADNYGGIPYVFAVGKYGYNKCQPSPVGRVFIQSVAAFYGTGVRQLVLYTGTNCSSSSQFLTIPNGTRIGLTGIYMQSFKIVT
ncbi:MAG TPA: hypothetical protein VGJ07_04785 [Rugosimonospora sp.]|jgi:hypothetical protein